MDVEATDDLRRRVRRFIFGINNELSLFFFSAPSLSVTPFFFESETFSKVFALGTLIFFAFVRIRTAENKRVDCRCFV